jgi:hypothetical protein
MSFSRVLGSDPTVEMIVIYAIHSICFRELQAGQIARLFMCNINRVKT